MSDSPLKLGAETRVSTTEYAYMNSARTVGLTGGGYVVLWGASIGGYVPGYFMQSYVSDVIGQRFDAAGNKLGGEFFIDQDLRYACDLGSAIATSDGGFLAVYYSYAPSVAVSGYEIVISKFDANGNRVGSESRVNIATDYSQERPHIAALDGGGYVVTWESREGSSYEPYDVHAQIFDSLGAAVGGEIVVNQTLTSYQEYAKVTGLAGGGFVVAWGTYGYDADGTGNGAAAMARIFAADGTPVTDEFVMNTTVAGNQQDPSIVALENGGFVAVWEAQNAEPAPGWGYGISAQIFDSTGSPVGGEIPVNTQVANEQRDPVVAAAPDGGFVVAWWNYADYGVHAQRFAVDGSRVGDEVRVDTYDNAYDDYLNNQASIDFLADGSYVISWARTSGGSSGAYAIFSQHFAAQDFGSAAGELINGTSGNDWLGGLGGDDTINGTDGADTLSGGDGTDVLTGGAGDDTYVDPTGDTIVEGSTEGTDTIMSGADFAMSDTAHRYIERLVLTGTAVSGTGNAYANALFGNAAANTLSALGGNDTLDGGAGADTLTGGQGNDTYVNPTGDTIVEGAGAGSGTDTVQSDVTFSLDGIANVERLFLSGTAAINGTGSSIANQINGNTGNNLLAGLAGADTLLGAAGGDTLQGGTGADRLVGGTQRDKLVPGVDSDADTIVYAILNDSTGVTRDVIDRIDFNGEDKIDLPGIVTAIAPLIAGGTLSTATFNANLAVAVTAAALPVGQAVLFDPSAGDQNVANTVYLIVDANGIAGYQANQDWVFQLENCNTTFLDPTDFI